VVAAAEQTILQSADRVGARRPDDRETEPDPVARPDRIGLVAVAVGRAVDAQHGFHREPHSPQPSISGGQSFLRQDKQVERAPAVGNILRLVAVVILAAAILVPIWSAAFPPLLDYPIIWRDRSFWLI